MGQDQEVMKLVKCRIATGMAVWACISTFILQSSATLLWQLVQLLRLHIEGHGFRETQAA